MGLGAVRETLAAGFDYASGGLEGGEVQATGQQVGFTLQGASPYPFVVNAPGEEGVYPFSGVRRDSDRKDTPVGASWGRATIRQYSNPGPCAPHGPADMIVAAMNESWAQGLDRWRKSASVHLTPGLHDEVTEATSATPPT